MSVSVKTKNMTKKITITVPKGWRKGEIFSDLSDYIKFTKQCDLFCISDFDFDKYVKEFIKDYK
jgi:retron-type reverse transcriptase